MIYARFNATDYKLEQRPVLTFSASETTFSEIVIDFTGKTANDLPIKYQEIQIVDTGTPDVVLYYGYCSQPSLPAFNGTQERVLLTIELMSPQTYLTKRTFDALIENVNIHVAVETILANVVNHDGFTIEFNDLPTTKYLSDYFNHKTVESILSNLGARFNFIWYVDELKKIYIKDLANLETAAPVYNLTSSTAQYLKSVQPFFNVSDYANRVNFINVILLPDGITGFNLIPAGTVLKDGRSYVFDYPVSTSKSVIFRQSGYNLSILFFQTNLALYQYSALETTRVINISDEIGIAGLDDDDATKKILLQRDENNKNILIGFMWKGADETVTTVSSSTVLRPITMSYIDPVEIQASAGKLNTSGIVEREVDCNGKYYLYDEITDYAKSFLRQNNKQADTVTVVFQGDDLSALKTTLALTNKMYINLPNQFIENTNYIITDVEYIIENETTILTVNAKIANLAENYIDIFRKEPEEKDENREMFITYYNQDEQTIISRKVIVDGEEVDV